jgi:hypothetical protein
MFVHPFHRIADSAIRLESRIDDEASSEGRRGAKVAAATGRVGRRGFFGTAIAGAAGLLALLAGRHVNAWQFTPRQADAWAGWRWRRFERDFEPRDFDRRGDERWMTTQAFGEEGGDHRQPRPPRERVTTYAIGEEGSGNTRPRPVPPSERVTTYAIGEEGSGFPRPREPIPRGGMTTQALGEEG